MRTAICSAKRGVSRWAFTPPQTRCTSESRAARCTNRRFAGALDQLLTLTRGLFISTDPGAQLPECGLVLVDYSLLEKERYPEAEMACITKRFRGVLTSDEDRSEEGIVLVPIPVQYNLGPIYRWRFDAARDDLQRSVRPAGSIPVELPGDAESIPVELDTEPADHSKTGPEGAAGTGSNRRASLLARMARLTKRYTSSE